jgi:hypothetical protein
MPRSIHSFKTPGQIKISGRTSSITNAFINGIMPFHKPTKEELLQAIAALEMQVDDVRCSYCRDEATEWDHLNPLIDEKAGTGYFTEIANLVPACGKCNQSKGNKPWKAWIRSSADKSPTTRNVLGLERNIALLEAYEARFKPTLVKLDAHVSPDLWRRHLENHAALLKAMKDANHTAEIIRREIVAKFGRRMTATVAVNQGNGPPQRNEDKFSFEGMVLGKGRLVLACIAKYVSKNPIISFAGLKTVFPDSLQGSPSGVFALREFGQDLFRRTGHKRFFLDDAEVVRLIDAEIVVSNQWGSRNFPGMLTRLLELGFLIESSEMRGGF